ncbi:MAG TPA: hypothetical protein VHP80_07985 [Candidatus Acidoferrum sp.]|nr:hypothetical protein [Candidatus Acidoferrum sp.]
MKSTGRLEKLMRDVMEWSIANLNSPGKKKRRLGAGANFVG